MNEEGLRMETGLPTKEVFQIVVRNMERFKYNINYYCRVTCTNLQDQVLMKLTLQ